MSSISFAAMGRVSSPSRPELNHETARSAWRADPTSWHASYVKLLFVLGISIFLSSCGGGGGGGGGGQDGGSESANFGCDGSCSHQNLSSSDVQGILAKGVAGANLLGVKATFAVTDRVGNVLAVYRMPGAPQTTVINGQIGAAGGLEGLTVPATLAAISKAGTGAYLSSQGNAFTTRTASQIIQENFNPGEKNQSGGPLFGVQFSQLLCSDVNFLDSAASGGTHKASGLNAGGLIGPRPLPLGLSADSGGIPLYKQGDLVGGLGVEFNGSYTLDRDPRNFDDDLEERIALYASLGFEAPSERVAGNISVGKTLRFTDLTYNDLDPLPVPIETLNLSGLTAVPPFFNGSIRDGAKFGDPSSGIADTVRAGVASSLLVSPSGAGRFGARNGSPLPGGAELTASEVDAILDSALVTASRTRAAIRRPLDTAARVSIWVVDTAGIPLGFTRSQDAPVFGIDVALQKARTSVFFSSSDAANKLQLAGFGGYVEAAKSLLGPAALTGGVAFTDRACGNLSRPFLPDGINGTSNGPFSHPFPGTGTGSTWSPFNTGLQLDVVFSGLATSLGLFGPISTIPSSCGNRQVFGGRGANGFQIFPGSVPLYRGHTLIGGIGISGDGVNQDDLIAFYGASHQGLEFAGHGGVGDSVYGFNAPKDIRASNIELIGEKLRLRYVNCPEAPFIGSNDQNVCSEL